MGMEHGGWDDGKWVVFPGTVGVEGWEVGVGVEALADGGVVGGPLNVLDVDAHDVLADFDDSGAAEAASRDAEHAEETIEEPHSAGGVEPELVAPFPLEEIFDVVPATDDDEDGQEYV